VKTRELGSDADMDREPVKRRVQASAADVADVLSNGWLYASWVVGASRIRGVDGAWPTAGTELAHSVGVWPFLISDKTTALLNDLPRRLELKARAWPVGEAHVVITMEETDEPNTCIVSISEDANSGPGRRVPKPLRHAAIQMRNTEVLRRLAMLAERKQAAEVSS